MNIDRRTTPDSSIPSSPMADVAFLLIIFFMVTSVFSATKGLEFKLPTDETPPGPDPEPAVLIHIQPGRIVVDCQPMEADQILPYLEPKLLRNPNKPVILYTDAEAKYRDMVRVYDQLVATRSDTNTWPFVVRDISVPTASDIHEYVELFGTNPLQAGCAK